MIAALGGLDFRAVGSSGGALQGGLSSGAAAGAAGPEKSFASVLADMASNTVGQLRAAEQLSVAGLQGQADTRAVVDAVMGAEQALQAAVAIRDKIVSAYMEVSRMGI